MNADPSQQPMDALHTVNLVTQCLCIPIITVFVGMRFSIRLRYRQFVGVEDWSCLVAWALFIGYCAIAIVVGKYGGGYHEADVSDSDLILFKKFCYIATVLYCPMALFVKIALLSIIIRIFSPYKNKIMFIYVLLGCLCIYYTIAEIVKIRMCDPVPAYWEGTPGASCLDQRTALIADSVISVVSDLIILILPLPLTWSLQMSRNKKLRVMGILSAGGLATAFSIYRLVLVLRHGNTSDTTIMFTCVILSGNAEGGVGLICACLPTLNTLIKKLRKLGSSYGSNKYYDPEQDSTMQLSRLKGLSSKRLSKRGSQSNNAFADSNEFGSDQSHLISYAGAVDVNSREAALGIQRTVHVTQTVEMLDEPDHAHLRQTRY